MILHTPDLHIAQKCAGKGIKERECAIKTFLGDVYWKLGEIQQQERNIPSSRRYFEIARNYFRDAIRLADKLKNPERQATAYQYYGMFLGRRRNEKVEKWLLKALKLAGGNPSETIGNANTPDMKYKWLISSIHNALGDHYLNTHQNFQLANEHFHKALDIAFIIDSRDMKALALFGLAQCPLTDEEKEQSTESAAESLNLLKEMRHYKRTQVEAWFIRNANHEN